MNTNTKENYKADSLSYPIPEQWRGVNIRTLFPRIPRKNGNIDFDIFDFEMLFKDKATNYLIRTGNTAIRN